MGKRERCTVITEGIIMKNKLVSRDCHKRIVVQYIVNGIAYHVKEALRMESHVIKLGFIPIGQRISPVMKNVTVGATTIVCYNPKNPEEAYLLNNTKKR